MPIGTDQSRQVVRLWRNTVPLSVVTAGLAIATWAAPQKPTRKSASPTTVPVAGAKLALIPSVITIDGSYGHQTLSAVQTGPDGGQLEVTNAANLKSTNPAVVKIENGIAYPVSDGKAELIASYGAATASSTVVVRNTKTDTNIDFKNYITPIFLRNSCNGAACHGAPNGQGGFKLSFFGYEADKDREAIWTGNGGRRVNPKDPENSLILLKAMAVVPHQGGAKFAKGGAEYRAMLGWIRAGGPLYPKSAMDSSKSASSASKTGAKLAGFLGGVKEPSGIRTLENITVLPEERVIKTTGSVHQIVVLANYSDGTSEDVTGLARYFSDDDGILSVKSNGKVTAQRFGEANVMVRYNGKSGVGRFYVLIRPRPKNYPTLAENNFVDKHVNDKLKMMGIIPAPLTDDAAFLRRVSLDIAGKLPTAVQVRKFIGDTDTRKRSKLIDELLETPEYQDVMTIEWSELLRINRVFLQEEGTKNYTAFLRDSIADNKPFDQFVRELITSGNRTQQDVDQSREFSSEDSAAVRKKQAVYRESSPYHNGPVNYYRVTADATDLTTSTSQIFLGVRLDCCRCHNHPFDRWSMNDFYGFAAFFSGTGYTAGKVKDEVSIFTAPNSEIRNPRTNLVVYPKPLTDKDYAKDASGDRKQRLADWITSKNNPFFSKAIVNRFWKHFFGRGIVHPVDDFRTTNPPANDALLNSLAKDFADSNFDIKHLIRTICNSRVYQLSDKTDPSNETDYRNFSHFYPKRLGAEVLFDAIVTATDVPETFGRANAIRATNLPDNSVPSYFLDVFGRGRRVQVAEKTDSTSMPQMLHLMNGGTVNDRIANPNGLVTKTLKRALKFEDMIEEIYLATLNRLPSNLERKTSEAYLKEVDTPKEALEDLMWAIINSREFIFNH